MKGVCESRWVEGAEDKATLNIKRQVSEVEQVVWKEQAGQHRTNIPNEKKLEMLDSLLAIHVIKLGCFWRPEWPVHQQLIQQEDVSRALH